MEGERGGGKSGSPDLEFAFFTSASASIIRARGRLQHSVACGVIAMGFNIT